MIKLDIPTEPYWLDLPNGVGLLVRPLSTAVYQTARAKGYRTARDVVTEQAGIRDSGGEVSGLPDESDDDALVGLSQFLFTVALARSAIIEWRGVLDAHGKKAKVTDESVRQLMTLPAMAEGFSARYTALHDQLVVEGNG